MRSAAADTEPKTFHIDTTDPDKYAIIDAAMAAMIKPIRVLRVIVQCENAPLGQISRAIVVAVVNIFESSVDNTVANNPAKKTPTSPTGKTAVASAGNASIGFAKSGNRARAYKPHVVVMRSKNAQHATLISSPWRAISGVLAAKQRWKKFGSVNVESAITYQTSTAESGCPPVGSKCVSGKERNGSSP